MTDEQKYEWYDQQFYPKLCKVVAKHNNGKGLWYEVYIDVDETFISRWWDFMYKYPNLALGAISRWMLRRDKWYWSPKYVSDLEAAEKKGLSPAEALVCVLDNSL